MNHKLIRIILLGGFLGAGKTTAAIRLAGLLRERGMKAGVITNDQGHQLVDGSLVRASGFMGAEIPGGCFCCRFDDFIRGLDRLANEGLDALIAEPVGSCTDLMATVLIPLIRNYPGRFAPAPYSVLADGPLLAELLTGESLPFSANVRYLYEKQLEEASVLLLNKADMLAPEQSDELLHTLADKYPGRAVLPVSSASGEGFDQWINIVLQEDTIKIHDLKEINYDRYAEAEAALGWYNGTLSLTREREFDPNDMLLELLEGITGGISTAGGAVAHLKAIATTQGAGVAKAGVTASDKAVAFTLQAYDLTGGMDVILNARVEMAPDRLKSVIAGQVEGLRARHGLAASFNHEECFRPGYPTPTWPR